MIDRRSPIPIYYQIEEYIKNLIENKDLKPGDMIPSERQFTDLFQVSRMTVRQAVMNLVNEGILIRLKGKGTFVSGKKIGQPLQGLRGFTEEMEKLGFRPSSQLLDFQVAAVSGHVADLLRLGEEKQVYEIKRIRLADEVPMAIETTYIPFRLVKNLTADIISRSLYSYIEKECGLEIDSASQSLEAALAGAEEANLLHVGEKAPVLLMERCTYLKSGQPVEFVKAVYRGDRYKFLIDVKR